MLKDLKKVSTSSSPVMQFWSWPLNSCFVILSRAIWPHTQIYEQFCIESCCILYMFLNYSNLRLQWEGYFCVSLLLPDQQGTFSVCRWQKEVFPSTWKKMIFSIIFKKYFQFEDDKNKFSLPPGKNDIFNNFQIIFSVWRWQKRFSLPPGKKWYFQ